MKLGPKRIVEFQEKMLSWYWEHHRSFPWRETTAPYPVLISEFLLQKTHVRKVVEIYPLVMQNYPSLQAMATADIVDLEKIIQPLGFLNRAERMVEMAQGFIQDYGGKIPADFDILVKMKGIGWYMATAVLVFAYGQKRVVVDTNVIRIIESEFGYVSENVRPRTDKSLWGFCQELAPDHNIREFNWALLDYGAEM